jgi:hypothetical protein
MGGLTTPPPSKEHFMKREFSAPPDLLQEFAADVLSHDSVEDQLLVEAINQDLSRETTAGPPANNKDVEMENASSCYMGAGNRKAPESPPQQILGAPVPVTPARRNFTVFPDDVSEFSDVGDGVSEDNSDSLFIPQSPVTSNIAHEISNPPRKSKKHRKSSGPRPKTAREWHKRQQAKLTPSQKRGPAFKRQELSRLYKRLKSSSGKRNPDNPPPRQSKVRVDPSIFLHGAPINRQPNPAHPSGSEPVAQPKEATGSNKRQYWKHFLEQNHGIDLHRCKTDWRQMDKNSASFGLGQMSRDDERWQLKGMHTSKSILSSLIVRKRLMTGYKDSIIISLLVLHS